MYSQLLIVGGLFPREFFLSYPNQGFYNTVSDWWAICIHSFLSCVVCYRESFFYLIQIKDFITQYVTGGRDGRRGQLLIKTKNSL